MTRQTDKSQIEIELPVPWSAEPAKVRINTLAAVVVVCIVMVATIIASRIGS